MKPSPDPYFLKFAVPQTAACAIIVLKTPPQEAEHGIRVTRPLSWCETMLSAPTTYIAITGYAVLAGADYVDAERVKLLNRVPSVHQVVEGSLS